ncbi:hypothetical protein FHX08_005249 [Rhizobium sp. BK529]|nr:hypothetical protein [Rhizobium sp. BK529]
MRFPVRRASRDCPGPMRLPSKIRGGLPRPRHQRQLQMRSRREAAQLWNLRFTACRQSLRRLQLLTTRQQSPAFAITANRRSAISGMLPLRHPYPGSRILQRRHRRLLRKHRPNPSCGPNRSCSLSPNPRLSPKVTPNRSRSLNPSRRPSSSRRRDRLPPKGRNAVRQINPHAAKAVGLVEKIALKDCCGAACERAIVG